MEQDRIVTTEKSLSKQDKIISKEKFIGEYCKKRGWDAAALTPSQLLEIVRNSSY